MTLYGSNKALELYHKQNPVVNVLRKPDAIDLDDIINIGSSNFRFAFSLERFLPGELHDIKNDPDYVKWQVRHYGRKNGEYFQNMLSYHPCTTEEIGQFYPINPEWNHSY